MVDALAERATATPYSVELRVSIDDTTGAATGDLIMLRPAVRDAYRGE
jgi:hypothetical protein